MSSAAPGRRPSLHPAGVLFDMDGLLIDTEPLWFAVETEILTELGATWDHTDHATLVGSSLPVSSKFIADRAGRGVTAEHIAEQLVGRMHRRLSEAPVLRPGVLALIDELDAAGVPRALVSSSSRTIIDAALDGLTPLTFDTVVAGDEVTRNKPHPEPYLLAAQKLGVDPAACVALEDSPSGAASAATAGCVVVAVPSVVAIEPGNRLVVRASLAGVDLEFLRSLFA